MKFLLAILLLLLGECTYSQGFHRCLIYQYYGNDSGSKALVLTQTFNERGKLVHEVSSHYINYESIGGKNTSNVERGRHI